MSFKSMKCRDLLEEVFVSLQKRPAGYVTAAVRKLELVAQLIGDKKLAYWCDFHLGRFRRRLVPWDEKEDLVKYARKLLLQLNEMKVEIPIEELYERLSKSGGGFQSIEFIEDTCKQLIKDKQGNDGKYYRHNLTNILTSVANGAARRASCLYSAIAFGDIPRDHFNCIRERVDNLLLDVCPDAIEQFMIAYERLAEGSSEDWSLALTICRRVIKSIADSIYPPTTRKSKDRKLGEAQYINRLWAFLDENLPASSDKDLAKAHVDYLGSFLHRLNEKASKGVHATVTHEEAVRSVLYTYLTIGDLLDFAGSSLVTSLADPDKVDLNNASIVELTKSGGVSKNIAKMIIKTRAKKPFSKVDDLLSIQGIGPKTLDRIRHTLVVWPLRTLPEDA